MRGARANHNANTIAPATDVSAELLVTWPLTVRAAFSNNPVLHVHAADTFERAV